MFRPKPILANIEWMETQMIKSFMVIYLLYCDLPWILYMTGMSD